MSTNNGSKTDYYDVFKDCIDVDSVTVKNNMTFAEGTILKSLVGVMKSRTGDGNRHSGTSAIRDLNKIIHYANLVKKGLENDTTD